MFHFSTILGYVFTQDCLQVHSMVISEKKAFYSYLLLHHPPPPNFVLIATIIVSYLVISSVRNLSKDQPGDFSSLHGIDWGHLEMFNWWLAWLRQAGMAYAWHLGEDGWKAGFNWGSFPFSLRASSPVLSRWLRTSWVIVPSGPGCQLRDLLLT